MGTITKLESEDKIKIWDKIIDVQMHFNDIKAKNQTLFIYILTACLAGMGYSLINESLRPMYLNIGSINVYVRCIPILGAIIFTFCFFIIDYSICQRLLKGSVECGKKVELLFFGLELSSHQIEAVSHNDHLIKCPCNNKKGLIKGAAQKHMAFYLIIFISLVGLFVLLNFGTLMT